MDGQKQFNQVIDFTDEQFQTLLAGNTDFIFEQAGGAILNLRLSMLGVKDGKVQIRVEGSIEQQVN